MYTNSSVDIFSFAFRLLTGVIIVFIFTFILTGCHDKSFRGVEKKIPETNPATDIDFNMFKLRWAFFFTILAMLSGLMIILKGIALKYRSPSSIRVFMIIALAVLFIEFLCARIFITCQQQCRKAGRPMIILQSISVPVLVKRNIYPRKKRTRINTVKRIRSEDPKAKLYPIRPYGHGVRETAHR